jgi:hypothetical protein
MWTKPLRGGGGQHLGCPQADLELRVPFVTHLVAQQDNRILTISTDFVMEVAGVVIGAIPIIIYALERYQDTRDTVRDFHKWNDTLGTLRSNIFLQKRQLFATLETLDIGFTDQTTMPQVEAALRISRPAQCEDIVRILYRMDASLNEIARNLYPDAQGPVRSVFNTPATASLARNTLMCKDIQYHAKIEHYDNIY